MTNNLKKVRMDKNLSQSELSKLTGISRTQLSRMENGQSIIDENIIKICKALNISADYLLGLVDHSEEVLHRQYTEQQILEIQKTLQTSADYFKNLIVKE